MGQNTGFFFKKKKGQKPIFSLFLSIIQFLQTYLLYVITIYIYIYIYKPIVTIELLKKIIINKCKI